MAALAIVIMSLGGMIPVATYICVVLCMLLCHFVFHVCGKHYAWAWYMAVSILGILLGTDKEAAGIYALLGYYPILKSWFDRRKIGILLKIIFFNSAIFVFYGLLIRLLGMEQLIGEYEEFGKIGLVAMLLLGNLTFFLVDRLLNIMSRKR